MEADSLTLSALVTSTADASTGYSIKTSSTMTPFTTPDVSPGYTGYSIKTSPTMTGAERAKKYRERKKAKDPEVYKEQNRERNKERRVRNGMEHERKNDRERKRRKAFIGKLEALKSLQLLTGVENNLGDPLDYKTSIDIIKSEHLEEETSHSGMQNIGAIKTESMKNSNDKPENLINEETLYHSESADEKQKCEKCGKYVKHIKGHLNNLHKVIKNETGKIAEPMEVENSEKSEDLHEYPNTENLVKIVSTQHIQLIKNLVDIEEGFDKLAIICVDGRVEFSKLLLVSASPMLRDLLAKETSENIIILDCCDQKDVQTSLVAYFTNRHKLVSKSIAKILGLKLERNPEESVESNDHSVYLEENVDDVGDDNVIKSDQDESRENTVILSPIVEKGNNFEDKNDEEEPKLTKTNPKSIGNECPKCGKYVKFMKTHSAKCHQAKKKTCPRCGKFVKHVKLHLSGVHGEQTRDIEMELALKKKCPECGKLVLHMRRHLSNFHKKRAPSKPNITNKLLQSFEAMELEKLFEAFAPDMENGEVICHLCAKSLPGLEKLRTHLKSDHKERKKDFKCTLCNREFHEKHTLKSHHEWVHGEKKVLCVECGKRFVRVPDLNKHVRIKHEGIVTPETVLCKAEDCNRLFKTIGSMNCHFRRTHAQVTFECKVCQKGGFSTKTWRTHRLRYHPELIRRKRKIDL